MSKSNDRWPPKSQTSRGLRAAVLNASKEELDALGEAVGRVNVGAALGISEAALNDLASFRRGMQQRLGKLAARMEAINELANLPVLEDGTLPSLSAQVEDTLKRYGSLDATQIALLLVLLKGGEVISEGSPMYRSVLSLFSRKGGSSPNRHRSRSAWSAASLAVHVRNETNRRDWSKAWQWLCAQSREEKKTGEFDLRGVDDLGSVVSYSHCESPDTVRTVTKQHFRDCWPIPKTKTKS